MSKPTEYRFEFGGKPYQISQTQQLYSGAAPCELTGKYDRVFHDNVETQWLEIAYVPVTQETCIEPTLVGWLRGERPRWGTTTGERQTKYINIDDLRCRAVIHEEFACIN